MSGDKYPYLYGLRLVKRQECRLPGHPRARKPSHLEKNRSVVVRINDRGPFASGRGSIFRKQPRRNCRGSKAAWPG